MMALVVRAATSDDVDAVLALWQLAEALPSVTDDAGALRALLSHDPGALVVAEEDGRVVGSVIAGWDGWRGSIYRLAVAPSHRGRRLGRELIAAAEQRLAELGANRSQAIVVATQQDAMRFWRSSGWEEQTERVRFVRST